MYMPPAFREERIEVLHAAIREAGLATLVTLTDEGLIASHVPLLLDPAPAPYGTLIGHLASPNLQATHSVADVQALAIFQGPDVYVTPNWYATKRETGKVVPTWNYVAIHAYGSIRFFHEPARLLEIVTRLTERHENPRAQPWAVADAPADFVGGMLRGIIGFEIPIARLQGKWKMSQNRPQADRAGVIAGLTEEGREDIAVLVAPD